MVENIPPTFSIIVFFNIVIIWASFVNETTQYEVRLFDIKTFTDIKVGTAITSLTASDHVQGARSGATGFVRSSGTSVTDISLIDVNGKFIKDESI